MKNTPLTYASIGLVVGLVFGLTMSLVSTCFVRGVSWLSDQRVNSFSEWFVDFPTIQSLAPIVFLLVAAFIVNQVRKIAGISRWHGPADSIYAAHRTDNELDIKAGFGSTLAAFVSASGGASVGQYGPLVHFGATMGSLIRRISGTTISTDVFIGCGVACVRVAKIFISTSLAAACRKQSSVKGSAFAHMDIACSPIS